MVHNHVPTGILALRRILFWRPVYQQFFIDYTAWNGSFMKLLVNNNSQTMSQFSNVDVVVVQSLSATQQQAL